MKIVAPADSVETEKLIEFLTTYYESPVYVRIARMTTPVVFDKNFELPSPNGTYPDDFEQVGRTFLFQLRKGF